MYANLKVTMRKPGGHREVLSAWQVVFVGTTGALVYLDANDGDGSYAVEAGERLVDLSEGATLTIEADF